MNRYVDEGNQHPVRLKVMLYVDILCEKDVNKEGKDVKKYREQPNPRGW